MIRTKLAKKVLKKKEQKHLTECNIRNMDSLRVQIDWMQKTDPENPWKICPDCFRIAKKLNII
jgi:hypothetical protein